MMPSSNSFVSISNIHLLAPRNGEGTAIVYYCNACMLTILSKVNILHEGCASFPQSDSTRTKLTKFYVFRGGTLKFQGSRALVAKF